MQKSDVTSYNCNVVNGRLVNFKANTLKTIVCDAGEIKSIADYVFWGNAPHNYEAIAFVFEASPLKYLPLDMFYTLSGVTYISLADGKFTVLYSHMFNRNTKLVTLVLRGSKLKDIYFDFNVLNCLIRLELAQTRVKILKKEYFFKYAKKDFTEITIGGIACDCRNIWIVSENMSIIPLSGTDKKYSPIIRMKGKTYIDGVITCDNNKIQICKNGNYYFMNINILPYIYIYIYIYMYIYYTIWVAQLDKESSTRVVEIRLK